MFHQTPKKDSLNRVFELVEYAYRCYPPNDMILEKAKTEYDAIDNPTILYEHIVTFVEKNRDNIANLSWREFMKTNMKQYDKKTPAISIKSEEDKVDLSGYLSFYDKDDSEDEFCSFTASNIEIFDSKYAPFGDTISSISFPETYIIDILNGKHKLDRTELDIIRSIETNIVALSYGRGEVFGTGILIHPSLVLTARHCIPGEDFSEIVVKKNYQKTRNEIMHFGDIVTISKKVEESVELDYTIIELDTFIEDFKPIMLELYNTAQEQMLFFHHPLGGPKKISSHKIEQSNYHMFGAYGYHDTKKGSSGGIYVDGEGKIIALHSMGKDRTIDGKVKDILTDKTTANWLKEIYSSSAILQSIYDENGRHKVISYNSLGSSASIYEYSLFADETISDKLLVSPRKLEYNSLFEKILTMQPVGYPGVNEGRDRRLPEWSYHHIIGKGDMEFLWMLAQESKILYDWLVKLLPQEYNYEDGRLTAIALVWAPWNLFVGPTNRPEGLKPGFDPHNGYITELLKPISFPSNHWEFLMSLSDKIVQCSKIRTQISGIQKEDLIDLLEPVQDGSSLEDCDIETITKRKYIKELNKIVIDLTKIYNIITTTTDPTWILKPPHKTTNDDWTMYKGQYKLRDSDTDGSPAQNVITITEYVVGAPLCIMAADAQENLIVIDKFSSSLMLLGQECSDSHSSLITIEDDIRNANNIDYSILAFSAQQGLRFFPTIVYFFKIFGINIPNIEFSPELKGLLDLTLGTIKINLNTPDHPLVLGQLLESGSYYASLKTIEILHERPTQQQPTDLISLFKICIPEFGNGLAAGVSLMSPSFIASGLIASSAQCLSKYNLFSKETTSQHILRIATDFFVGAVSIYMSHGNVLTKVLAFINGVVITDITTKVFYSVYDIGVNDIEFLGENSMEHEMA